MGILKDKFISELSEKPPEILVSSWMIERVPYIFANDSDLYINWKHMLSDKINVDSASILFTGSSSLGLSLNPYKNFKLFEASSDIDVAIISDYYFDIAWHYLRNLGTKIHSFSPIVKNSILEHTRNYVYWGIVATDKILPILPFGRQWGISLEEMRKVSPTEDRNINARIFKDFGCLRSYHVANIKKLRSKVLEEDMRNV